MKLGILIVAFGTVAAEGEAGLARVAAQAEKTFPNASIAFAYTSRVIRDKLDRKDHPAVSPRAALRRLVAEGCGRILVWPLFVAAGREFSRLEAELKDAAESLISNLSVVVGPPLLEVGLDTGWIADALVRTLPQDVAGERAVILVGHGSRRWATAAGYAQLLEHLRRRGGRYYFATLEGPESLPCLLPVLAKERVRSVLLVPVLILIGRHVKQDLAGSGAGSWRSVLAAQGIACEVWPRAVTDSEELLQGWAEGLALAAEATARRLPGGFPA